MYTLQTAVLRTYIYDEDLGIGIGTPSGTTGKINPFQAFWVKAEGTNPSINLEETDKTIAGSQLYRTASLSNLLKISVTQDGLTDETILRLSKNATTLFDLTKDARKQDQSFISISSYSTDNVSLSINSFNMEHGNNIEIPLSIVNDTKTQFEISFDGIEAFDPDITIELYDDETGVFTELVTNESIVITAFNNPTRYKVIFSRRPNLITNSDASILNSKFEIYPNPNDGNTLFFNIQADSKFTGHYVIIDELGTKIYAGQITPQENKNTTEIKFDKTLSDGFYYIQLLFETDNIVQKFVVNNK